MSAKSNSSALANPGKRLDQAKKKEESSPRSEISSRIQDSENSKSKCLKMSKGFFFPSEDEICEDIMENWKGRRVKGTELLGEFKDVVTPHVLNKSHLLTLQALRNLLIENDLEVRDRMKAPVLPVLKNILEDRYSKSSPLKGSNSGHSSNEAFPKGDALQNAASSIHLV